MLKRCSKCKREKDLSVFPKNKRMQDGYHVYCKECQNVARKKYLETKHGRATAKAAVRRYFKTEKGKAALKRGVQKQTEKGYYRFGKGAIPILWAGAKKRGVAFNLTVGELENWWMRTKDVCHYCGITLEEFIALRDTVLGYKGDNREISKFKKVFFTSKQAKIKWMTIDRVDNGKGYFIDNIVKACWFCNYIKSVLLTSEDMKLIAKNIMQRLKRAIEGSMSPSLRQERRVLRAPQ